MSTGERNAPDKWEFLANRGHQQGDNQSTALEKGKTGLLDCKIVAFEDEPHHSPLDNLKHCINKIACNIHDTRPRSLYFPLHKNKKINRGKQNHGQEIMFMPVNSILILRWQKFHLKRSSWKHKQAFMKPDSSTNIKTSMMRLNWCTLFLLKSIQVSKITNNH